VSTAAACTAAPRAVASWRRPGRRWCHPIRQSVAGLSPIRVVPRPRRRLAGPRSEPPCKSIQAIRDLRGIGLHVLPPSRASPNPDCLRAPDETADAAGKEAVVAARLWSPHSRLGAVRLALPNVIGLTVSLRPRSVRITLTTPCPDAAYGNGCRPGDSDPGYRGASRTCARRIGTSMPLPRFDTIRLFFPAGKRLRYP
jgi:hypothetical protein